MTPSQKIRYVLVCYSYPPVLGGSEVEAQRVSEALQNRGHGVRILCAGGDPMPQVTEWKDDCGLSVRIMAAGWPARLRGYGFALAVAWRLFKERRNYDVAYFLMHGLHVALGLPVARLLGKPIVMKFSCSSLVAQMTESFIGRLQVRLLRRWAASVLILNPGMEEEAKEVGLRPEQIGWMPNPVDVNWFRPCASGERAQIRSKLGVDPNVPLVVFVGRLDYQKEIPWLLGSFALVVRERPNAKLALIGDGPLRAEMEQRSQSLGITGNVIFAGRLPMSGVLEWLQAGDMFTLVSAVEGLPCSLIEAMSAGLPSVLSRIPAHTQIVDDGVHGVLTELGNLESIAEGMLQLMDDPQRRSAMGEAARQLIVERFSTPRVAECYEALFSRVLDRSEPKPGSPANLAMID